MTTPPPRAPAASTRRPRPLTDDLDPWGDWCVKCDKPKPTDGYWQCANCRAANRASQAERHDARRAAGECLDCAAPCRPRRRCPRCLTRRAAGKRLQYRQRFDAGQCTGCGSPLESWSPHHQCSNCRQRDRTRYKHQQARLGLPVSNYEVTP